MEGLLTVAIINFLALLSPGPDFAIVTKNAVAYSRRAGLFTSLGITCGIIVHSTYCILGLAIIITKSILLFDMVKYLGAAYLIYIGIKSLIEKRSNPKEKKLSHSNKTLRDGQAWRQGFLTNLLNPKCALFFLGLFTLVIKSTTPLYWRIIYGLEITLATLLWFSFLSVMINHRAIKKRINQLQYWVTKLMGGFLVFFGVELILFHKNP